MKLGKRALFVVLLSACVVLIGALAAGANAAGGRASTTVTITVWPDGVLGYVSSPSAACATYRNVVLFESAVPGTPASKVKTESATRHEWLALAPGEHPYYVYAVANATSGCQAARSTAILVPTQTPEWHKFHAIVRVQGYRGECEVGGRAGGVAFGVSKRTCFGSFIDFWPFPGPGGDGNPPFNSGPDRSSFSWDATAQPGRINLRVRNETKKAELSGHTPAASSPDFFVSYGSVSEWHAKGPIVSGTDPSKVGQPGGPLDINVRYSNGSSVIKTLHAGYLVNLNGYLDYSTQ